MIKLHKYFIRASVVFLLCTIVFCLFFKINNVKDLKSCFEMCFIGEYHPIWKDLALGKITQGQNIRSITQKWTPQRITKDGNRVMLTYWWPDSPDTISSYIGITLTVKNGKVIAAESWSCTSHYCFF